MKHFFSRARYALGMLKFLYFSVSKEKLGYCGKNVMLVPPIHLTHPEQVFLYDDTNIFAGATFLMSKGKFIMKRHSGAAQGLTVVTNTHLTSPGEWFKDSVRRKYDRDVDIVVEEDVWIGTNVTLLAGSHIGRGATIGGGAVVRTRIPPYAIVIGNPVKVAGFRFTPDETVEHEKALYPEEARLPQALLEKNYEKYFLSRFKEIAKYSRL